MEANLELQRLSNEDSLTGLKNRRYFDEFLESEWNRSVRNRSPLSLLLIDIDDFKQYNDTNGHLAGDSALRSVAAALRAIATRPGDCVVRFGGEEFGVILPSTSLAGAQILGEEYRRSVEDLHLPYDPSTDGNSITVSVGGRQQFHSAANHFCIWLMPLTDRCIRPSGPVRIGSWLASTICLAYSAFATFAGWSPERNTNFGLSHLYHCEIGFGGTPARMWRDTEDLRPGVFAVRAATEVVARHRVRLQAPRPKTGMTLTMMRPIAAVVYRKTPQGIS